MSKIAMLNGYFFRFGIQTTLFIKFLIMRLILRNTLLLLLTISGVQLFAQPANDDCTGAFPVTVGADEESAILVEGDTRGATGSTEPANVCSGSWFGDDIWFSVTIDEDVPEGSSLVFKTYFDNSVIATDIPACGMAVYTSCGVDEPPINCFSTDDPTVNSISLPGGACTASGNTYYIRVWSGGSPTDFSGTLALGAYIETGTGSDDNVLWEEQFASNPFDRGWVTEGVCAIIADSSVNAVFDYLENGGIMASSFTSATVIASSSFCNGAVGVNSDFNDNGGDMANIGGGSVPTGLNATGSQSNPATYDIISPAIYTGDFNVAGISVTFTQDVRHLNSQFFISHRNKATGDTEWSDWADNTFQFNEDLAPNDDILSGDVQRLFLPNALDGDSIQLRIRYVAHYYYFIMDDLRLVETEANNMRAQENWYATAPYGIVPASQVRPYHGMIDIYNAGAATQMNVGVNYTVMRDGSEEIFNEDLAYGSIEPDSLAENKLFPNPVVLPNEMGTYTGMYTVFADAEDFDDSDNSQSYSFTLGGPSEYAYETGATRNVAVATGVYDDGAPLSYAYGNVFSCPNGSDLDVTAITWGVANVEEMAGLPVNILLYQWTDQNGNEIVEFDEREILGLAGYTFIGDEGANAILTTPLENFENPGDPITLQDGGTYIAMVEYQANTGDDPQFFMLASEAVNYSPITFAMDSAFIKGWVDYRTYVTCLGVSADGNIAGIDYEVKELDVNDTRVFFGNDIQPLVRLNLQASGTTSTEDLLAEENVISTFPNPASELLTIQLQMENVFDRVDLRVHDMTGQLILSRTLRDVQNQVEKLNVKSLPAGTYMLRVVTDEGQRTKPFVVQH